MNWGHKITIVIIVFLVGMTGMVYVASKQTNEMIDEKYYEKELVYQDLINAKENLKNVTAASMVQQQQGRVQIQLPVSLASPIENGTISFLRNEDKSQDIQLKLQPDAQGVQVIDKSLLKKGWYKFRIRWSSNGKAYYSEENLRIES